MVFLVAELVDVQEAEESVSFFVPRQHQFGSRFFPLPQAGKDIHFVK